MNIPPRHDRTIAATVTAVTTAILLLVICLVHLRGASPAERQWPPADTSEILLPTDIVPLQESIVAPQAMRPEQAPREARATEGSSQGTEPEPRDATDLTDGGEPSAVPTPEISADKPSEMKVVNPPKEVKTGPSKEQLEKERRERQQQARSDKRNSQMKNAFGKSTAAPNAPAGGDSDGHAATGVKNGRPDFSLAGRTLAGWDKARVTAPSGTVTIEVRVNRQGKVTEATYLRGTGVAGSTVAVRRDCERRALASTFSVSASAPAEQVGTITYTFTTRR